MAKIVSETLAIEISRISKDGVHLSPIINEEITATLEQVVQELVGDGAVVEIFAQSAE